jgi:hypothetical protein
MVEPSIVWALGGLCVVLGSNLGFGLGVRMGRSEGASDERRKLEERFGAYDLDVVIEESSSRIGPAIIHHVLREDMENCPICKLDEYLHKQQGDNYKPRKRFHLA